MCHFGADCTRKICTFGYTKADNAKRAQNGAGRGKGSDTKSAKGKGAGKGSKSSAKGAGKAEVCKAFGCKAPGEGYRFCTKCHRKGIESGGKVKHKDGTMIEVKLSKSSQQEKRIAQLEKQLGNVPAADGDDPSSDDEPVEPVKRKRANIVNVMERLGLPNKRAHTDQGYCEQALFEIVGRHCNAVVKGKLRKDGPAGIQGPAKRVRFDLNEVVAKAVKDCKASIDDRGKSIITQTA